MFRYLGHIVLLGRTWISAPCLLQLKFTIIIYRTWPVSGSSNSICAYLCNTVIFAIVLYVRCDIKLHLRHWSHDKMEQAFCTNLVLQATDVQDMGTRLGYMYINCKWNRTCDFGNSNIQCYDIWSSLAHNVRYHWHADQDSHVATTTVPVVSQYTHCY